MAANYRYFAEHAGQTVQLTSVWHDGHVRTTVDHFFGLGPDGTKLRAERKIEYKSQPSRHACDARCINAIGRIMKCECSCGGRNHGRGTLRCTA